MKRIRIFWVGKTKEGYIKQAIDKYYGLIRRFVPIELITLKEEKGSDVERILKKEAERILKAERSYVLLSEKGRLMDSLELAEYLFSHDEMSFLLGGAYGVSEDVYKMARDVISLSPMTFTHELARVILLEQLYRAITIKKGMRYHH